MTNRPEIRGGGVLGEKITGVRRQLDTFKLPVGNHDVTYISDEVMSFCPITGQPDWYEAEIWLVGTHLGLESKSLKLYLQSFNDPQEGQFCEAFADRICEDVWEAIEGQNTPDHPIDKILPGVQVTLKQKPRGGISIEAVSVRGAVE